jgi:aspartyl-tRNA(Asn)/glutamyl-tRNA(Gln) amidotransferase subunit C
MKITADQVQHVARLARLQIEPEAVEKLASELATILAYVDKLNEVDTRGVAPMTHAIELVNAFRDDVVHAHLPREQALGNAPSQDEGSFVVPKLI